MMISVVLSFLVAIAASSTQDGGLGHRCPDRCDPVVAHLIVDYLIGVAEKVQPPSVHLEDIDHHTCGTDVYLTDGNLTGLKPIIVTCEPESYVYEDKLHVAFNVRLTHLVATWERKIHNKKYPISFSLPGDFKVDLEFVTMCNIVPRFSAMADINASFINGTLTKHPDPCHNDLIVQVNTAVRKALREDAELVLSAYKKCCDI